MVGGLYTCMKHFLQLLETENEKFWFDIPNIIKYGHTNRQYPQYNKIDKQQS